MQVRQLSGGMKRRLSLAISIIGNPKIIFMDEPTSGMDPIIRRQVWDVIRHIKKTTTIVLTTHSMEEADILSDRIGIMVKGEFVAIDTSIGLKNQFSEGYKINIVTKRKYTKEAALLSEYIIPGIKVLNMKGGSLVMTLTSQQIHNALLDETKSSFFKLVQKDHKDILFDNPQVQRLSQIIYNFGISQITLEEVFTILNKKDTI